MIYRDFNEEIPVIITVEDFRFILRPQINRLRDFDQDMRDVGWTLIGSDQTRHLKEKPIRKHPVPNSSMPSSEQPLQKKSSKSIVDPTCIGCGRNNHTVESCHFKGSPYYNSSDQLYSKSEAFVKLRRDFPTNVLAPSAKFLAENAAKTAEKATNPSSLKQNKIKQKGNFYLIPPTSRPFQFLNSILTIFLSLFLMSPRVWSRQKVRSRLCSIPAL